ncbi:MAG: Gfo/Idh/MocA family oxidoreductase [bacterium]|nr:Gfo/Idh/MocA family oxidoreductase [bacterium]
MNKIRIGIIGVGRRARLSKYWHNPEGKSVVIAGADINQEMLNDFRKEVNQQALITCDYQELLRKKDIDAVAVMSPDHTHEHYTIAAFAAGKHVYCEKPMAITTSGCDRMLVAWHKSHKHFMVGFNMRYMPIFRLMKNIIDSGAIGEIKSVWVRHFVGNGGASYYHDWHANTKWVTSLLLHKASHDFDMIHWLTGQYTKKVAAFGSLDYYGGTKPNNLKCSACCEQELCMEFVDNKRRELCAFRKEINVEDNNIVMMELENNIKAVYMQCFFTPDYFRNYTIIGTEGRIENTTDRTTVKLLMRNNKMKWKSYADGEYTLKQGDSSHSGSDFLIAQDFINMILYDKKPLVNPLDGRMSVAVGYAATESLRQGGKIITVPPPPSSSTIRNNNK